MLSGGEGGGGKQEGRIRKYRVRRRHLSTYKQAQSLIWVRSEGGGIEVGAARGEEHDNQKVSPKKKQRERIEMYSLGMEIERERRADGNNPTLKAPEEEGTPLSEMEPAESGCTE